MLKDNISRDIIRPLIYKVFARLIYGTVFSLAAAFFIQDSLRDIRSYGFALCAVLSFFGGWCAYLRLDGMKLARIPEVKLPKRKKPVITYGDIEDHIDDDITTFEELPEGEKNMTLLIADAILTVIFALISVLV